MSLPFQTPLFGTLWNMSLEEQLQSITPNSTVYFSPFLPGMLALFLNTV